jgi:hypothetical protein
MSAAVNYCNQMGSHTASSLWELGLSVQSPKSKVQSQDRGVQSLKSKVQSLLFRSQRFSVSAFQRFSEFHLSAFQRFSARSSESGFLLSAFYFLLCHLSNTVPSVLLRPAPAFALSGLNPERIRGRSQPSALSLVSAFQRPDDLTIQPFNDLTSRTFSFSAFQHFSIYS